MRDAVMRAPGPRPPPAWKRRRGRPRVGNGFVIPRPGRAAGAFGRAVGARPWQRRERRGGCAGGPPARLCSGGAGRVALRAPEPMDLAHRVRAGGLAAARRRRELAAGRGAGASRGRAAGRRGAGAPRALRRAGPGLDVRAGGRAACAARAGGRGAARTPPARAVGAPGPARRAARELWASARRPAPLRRSDAGAAGGHALPTAQSGGRRARAVRAAVRGRHRRVPRHGGRARHRRARGRAAAPRPLGGGLPDPVLTASAGASPPTAQLNLPHLASSVCARNGQMAPSFEDGGAGVGGERGAARP
mmetsp:Transcript_1388/g.4158  ORF Transcript_1388/g.4158 Transcript_1388/m.4158 type:complete len:305 (+) Transcript_1388:315-1229(+)